MTRQWRVEFEGAYYRILPRGNERRNIFNDNQEIGNLFGLGYTSLSRQVTIMKPKMSGEDEMNKRLDDNVQDIVHKNNGHDIVQ